MLHPYPLPNPHPPNQSSVMIIMMMLLTILLPTPLNVLHCHPRIHTPHLSVYPPQLLSDLLLTNSHKENICWKSIVYLRINHSHPYSCWLNWPNHQLNQKVLPLIPQFVFLWKHHYLSYSCWLRRLSQQLNQKVQPWILQYGCHHIRRSLMLINWIYLCLNHHHRSLLK